jgi:hypothetical protein
MTERLWHGEPPTVPLSCAQAIALHGGEHVVGLTPIQLGARLKALGCKPAWIGRMQKVPDDSGDQWQPKTYRPRDLARAIGRDWPVELTAEGRRWEAALIADELREATR